MEFTKDINFSSDLKGNQTTKITYSGDLYKKGSDFVAIVYGFGENWEHTTEKGMEKTEAGFTTEIEMKENFDTFNFCFRNGDYEWDNNQSFNYISTINPVVSKEEVSQIEYNDFVGQTESGFNDLIIEILDSILDEKVNTSNVSDSDTDKQQILEDILSENTNSVGSPVFIEEFDMDALVENILNPVINCQAFEETQEIVGTDSFEKVEPIENLEELFETGSAPSFAEVSETVQEENGSGNESVQIGLVSSPELGLLVSPRKLRKLYLIKKKIKLAVYKLVVTIPKLLSGNFNEDKN